MFVLEIQTVAPAELSDPKLDPSPNASRDYLLMSMGQAASAMSVDLRDF